MNENAENTCGYREAWRLNLRTWKMWMRRCPGYFLSAALSAAAVSYTHLTLPTTERV